MDAGADETGAKAAGASGPGAKAAGASGTGAKAAGASSTGAQGARVPCASVEQVLARPDALVVDLRSPSEFAEDHLPGAVNAPLFDDVERAVIGTLYRRESPSAAFEEARLRARARIAELVRRIADAAGWNAAASDLEQRLLRMTEGGIVALESALDSAPVASLPERPVVLHCWRGGLRSRSVVAFLRAIGLERAVGLAGGYREYRRHVVAELEAWSAPPCFVLRGLTGVGKTLVLHELERIRPGWTLDLEGIAGHRGSILGMVGLAPVGQKAFESGLHARARRGFDGCVVMEGESRKVGDAVVPARVWETLEGGESIELVAPLERRVDVLLAEYVERAENRAELRERLPFLEQRLGARKWKDRLVALLDQRRDRELVALLLELYYDPLYRHSEKGHAEKRDLELAADGGEGGERSTPAPVADGRSYALRVDSSDVARAAERVAAFVEERLGR